MRTPSWLPRDLQTEHEPKIVLGSPDKEKLKKKKSINAFGKNEKKI